MRFRDSIVIALVSITLLALELAWTRLFSAEFFYTFAFLILSLAIMGLGLGALTLRLFPSLGRERTLAFFLLLTGLLALAGPILLFLIGLDFARLFGSWTMVAKFLLVTLLLGSSFFFGGLVLAGLFKRNYQDMPRMYMADLLGAGVGVFVAVVLMNTLGTPTAAFVISVPVLLAALILARGWLRAVPLVLVLAALAMSTSADTLLESGREERAPVIYKHWDAMAKIKVYNFGGVYRGVNIDNVANSPVVPFDGDWEAHLADSTRRGWDIDVGYLVAQFDSCRFLSLGAGGGMDVFHALEKGAAEVHAVEVNAHLNRMMLEGDSSGYVVRDSSVVDSTGRIITMPEYSGYLYQDPRVKVVTEDARTYVRRHKNAFDVIFSLSSNTWAALGSGSFALAENYLFTTEAFKDYWEALSENGFMSMEHQMYMPRLVASLTDALRDIGIDRPEDHFAVYNLPKLRRNVLLLSKRPLTEEIRYLAYGALTPERHETMHLLYPAPDTLRNNLVHQIVTAGWETVADTARIDISPCTDDRPFPAQLGLWRNLRRDNWSSVNMYSEFRGFPLSKMIIVIILTALLLVVIPLNLVPYVVSSQKLNASAWLYFFLIGVAFMSVEVVLIQRYTLFIGVSSYSIATVLLTLLVASGLGSLSSRRIGNRTAFAGIILWLLVEVVLLRTVTHSLAGLGLEARVAVAALAVFPLGFFMGMPFPKGALRVGELVDWGFAVNGAASVLGAAGVLLLVFAYGFRGALLAAAVVYLLAGLLLTRLPAGESGTR